MDHQRDPGPPGRQGGAHRHVASHGEESAHFPFDQLFAYPFRRGHDHAREPEIGGAQRAAQTLERQPHIGVPGRGDHICGQSIAAEEHDVVLIDPLGHQRVGDGQARIDMAARAGGGDGVTHRASRDSLAMATSTPTAARLVIKALPPNDMKGSGTPVIGTIPATPPILTTA